MKFLILESIMKIYCWLRLGIKQDCSKRSNVPISSIDVSQSYQW
jgi:hypothetical protein